MIYLFTDFGYQGPYIGELKAVLTRELSPGQLVIDLMHDSPHFDPESSAYLLSALSNRFEKGDACLAVVDPGVGNPRRLPISVHADGVTYVGPDNGLFSQVIKNADNVQIHEIIWRPDSLSNSFHGRDLFAPALSKIINRQQIDLRPLAVQQVTGIDWPANLNKVIYIDGFGNLVTGINAEVLSSENIISIAEQEVLHAETFSSKARGEAFWYENSMGLIEIAVNQARADEYFQAKIGTELSVID
jgi:S-adenosylmethionine hydrolase